MRSLAVTALLLSAASTAAAQAPHAADHASHVAQPASKKVAARPSTASSARVVTITARDFAFEAPDTVAAGLTTLKLVNRGPELHHVQLIRLDAGKTMKDFFAAVQQGGPPPSWASDVGGPNTPVPGGESQATLDLAPGRYAMVCFIPSADGKPHVAKGMARELVVAPAKQATTRPASAAAAGAMKTMTLADYSFNMSAPITAGRQTIRVRNAAAQSHEVLFVRLAPGKSVADLAAWVEKQNGPPPAAPLGGTTAIAAGGWNDVAVTFEPGEYGLLCFIPDAKDGKPHVAHGMMQQFTVAAGGAGARTAKPGR